ncbi:SET domain-containing protein-lysine N-methyltransferase [bacterium]|nr:SET domain-containing protein-lysine N-methyltransferase [bacterium]
MRFYPDFIPPFEHEPTTDGFSIEWIDQLRGYGIRTWKSFSPGEIVYAFRGFYSQAISQFSLQINTHLHLHDPYFMGKTLHSCDPNCDVVMKDFQLVAIKPIQHGDVITIDYEKTEDVLFKEFQCRCSAENCRGSIVGRTKRQMMSSV